MPPLPPKRQLMHMQARPGPQAFPLAAWSAGRAVGIYISPDGAHSWAQTGTGANMQKRQSLHSARRGPAPAQITNKDRRPGGARQRGQPGGPEPEGKWPSE